MDVKVASQKTLALALAAAKTYDESMCGLMSHARLSHLKYMDERIQAGVHVQGEKAHRWLGWMQACVYLAGAATHDQLQQINREA